MPRLEGMVLQPAANAEMHFLQKSILLRPLPPLLAGDEHAAPDIVDVLNAYSSFGTAPPGQEPWRALAAGPAVWLSVCLAGGPGCRAAWWACGAGWLAGSLPGRLSAWRSCSLAVGRAGGLPRWAVRRARSALRLGRFFFFWWEASLFWFYETYERMSYTQFGTVF